MTTKLLRMWTRVKGQDRAVRRLQDAVNRPVHAYLLAGPVGCGIEEAARVFGTELIGCDDDRVLRSRHPDVVEFVSEGITFRIKEDIREGIIPEASRSPIECDCKVILIHEAERLREDAANSLLKTLEEPPSKTRLILTTYSMENLLDTVISRCQLVEFHPLPDGAVIDALTDLGADSDRAIAIAKVVRGNVTRGISLLTNMARVHDAFSLVPSRIDGNGATVAQIVDDLIDVISDASTELESTHKKEISELETECENAGYPERTSGAMKTRLKARHQRAARRVKVDALTEGLATLEAVYRDACVPGEIGLVALDRNLDPPQALAALDRLGDARRRLEFNPSEQLLLEWLLLALPPLPPR